MKKLLFVLVCAASLGFWMSCNNGAQELDITLHSGVDKKDYSNAGTVTATKVTMVTNKGAKVTFDTNGKVIVPTDRKDYYISDVFEKGTDGVVTKVQYWFYNDWDAGTDIAADKAFVSWGSNVWYESDGASAGIEAVSNTKEYKFSFGTHNDDVDFWVELPIEKNGNVYQYTGSYREYGEYGNSWEVYYDNIYGTAALEVSGNMEGDFTIGTLVKKLDSKYGVKEEGENYGRGSKYTRLDARTEYELVFVGNDDETGAPMYEYRYPEDVEQDTGVYYLKDVKFTKN